MDFGNGDDSYTVTSETSWLGRIGNSIVGALFGVLFLIGGPWLLWWNEGNQLREMNALNQAQSAYVESVPDKLDPANEGRLIHVVGTLTSPEHPRDSEFGVEAENQLRLLRHVKMYQWHETSETSTDNHVGGGQTKTTTYRYDKIWSENEINSSSFHNGNGHHNPSMPVKTARFDLETATLGAYQINQEMISKFSDFQTHVPSNSKAPRDFVQTPNGFYRGNDPSDPRIGDLEITYSSVPLQTVSVLAAQRQNLLVHFVGDQGVKVGMIKSGNHLADEMIQQEKRNTSNFAWILRGVGLVINFIALMLLMGPFTALAAFIPLFEDLAEFASAIVAIPVSIALSATVIAIAWFSYRPIIGACMIGVVVLCVFGLTRLRRKREVARYHA